MKSPAPAVAQRLAAAEAAPQVVPAAVRMVIRTANMILVVDNAAEYLLKVVAIVEGQGGYVADTRQWREDGQLRATATLRIPAGNLTPALQAIRKDAVRVSEESVSGQDVSEEYVDLGAQLTNLRATESELRQLLTSVRERTQKASEVLEVYKELSRIRGDIDRLQGRVDFFKQMTAMSTINVELVPDNLSEPIVEPGWRPVAVAKAAARSFVAVIKGLGAVLIWVIVFALPLALVFGLFVFLGKKLWKPVNQWRRRRVPQPPPGIGGQTPNSS